MTLKQFFREWLSTPPPYTFRPFPPSAQAGDFTDAVTVEMSLAEIEAAERQYAEIMRLDDL